MASAKPISPAEPITDLRHIKILECGEELVNFLEVSRDLVLDTPRFNYRRETMVRTTVANMLAAASDGLKSRGYRLAVVEGWRPLHIQQRMYRGIWKRFQDKHPDWSETKLRRVVNKFTAPIDSRVAPPHSTGGAVDVLLADETGRILDHVRPFERFDSDCYAFDAPGLGERARRHRDILAEALLAAGLTNYPSEYWHWSYGDQGWAYRTRGDYAIYGSIVPPDWIPDSRDISDEPLTLIEEST